MILMHNEMWESFLYSLILLSPFYIQKHWGPRRLNTFCPYLKWDLHGDLSGSKVGPPYSHSFPVPQGGLAFPPQHSHTACERNLQNGRFKTVFSIFVLLAARDSIPVMQYAQETKEHMVSALFVRSGLISSWSCLLLWKQKFFKLAFFTDLIRLSHLSTRASHPWKVIMVVLWVWKTYSL